MKFIFWQNIVSIHQFSFLESLAVTNQVILIVDEEIEFKRKSHGWNVPQMKNVAIIVNPNKSYVDEILKQNFNAFHFFSGLEVYPLATLALKKSVKLSMPNLGILLEPFNNDGFKGSVRSLKYSLLILKYKKNIKILFPTGMMGRKSYEKIGFPTQKIFDWGYFTQLRDTTYDTGKLSTSKTPNLLFVGSIDKRKNIIDTVLKTKKYRSKFNEFIIVGTGELESELQDLLEGFENIIFRGGLQNSEVKILMEKCDILILPSLFDGWGAVINEALQAGMQVIASENCGASILLDGCHRGEVFSFSGKNDFDQVLAKWLKKEPLTKEKRIEIAKWSANHISGEVAASYFESVIRFTLGNEVTRPIAPWLKK
ncbi:glycosyltransferase involved in cell wall biosynthesis [Flavobacterium sp. CG_9.1]|uniref:glycosyltransferase family 4 protein n=1 Tax=Flavobacterium sp. CG_9.1 TaxID=2787728 RepID=UPI0018CA0827|nr:glycosyltransferase [Flavobacterium sp. CG_9.1]MBG6062547.1 glycosyltransferase involved in cell wall biosynthesis [Flavobacterium sp. CG_9.1]